MAAWRTGRMDSIGFSIDAMIGARQRDVGMEQVLEVEKIVAIHSVDMVGAASSGGRILNLLETGLAANHRVRK